MTVTGVITQIQRFSINDGPGIRTTVFLKGCPLKCSWCHNPETKGHFPEIFFRAVKCIGCGRCQEICPVPDAVKIPGNERIDRTLCIGCLKCTEICPSGALVRTGQTVSVENVITEVLQDLPFYSNSGGGMTVSGGEPMAQVDFTVELLKVAKIKGIHTCLDTSGYATTSAWKKVLPHLNMVLFDIKQMDAITHKKFTGVSNELILENLKQIASKVEVRIRIPLIPGFNDTNEFIEKVGLFSKSIDIKGCDLLPFHDYAISKYIMLGREDLFYRVKHITENRIMQYKEQLEKHGLQVKIGGKLSRSVPAP